MRNKELTQLRSYTDVWISPEQNARRSGKSSIPKTGHPLAISSGYISELDPTRVGYVSYAERDKVDLFQDFSSPSGEGNEIRVL
ncbi:hypothetical protein LSH36_535g01048 [Paralvinella palmiformis]|uniref:Uncharacterized protein n=1 Tax=Paralvinella palmiformis TaxID=53620 RepID=A0AAD9J6Z4_9ANNE|nr:hypothetical protein LSH36_535g01048 [Paralvinella palmiformis]